MAIIPLHRARCWSCCPKDTANTGITQQRSNPAPHFSICSTLLIHASLKCILGQEGGKKHPKLRGRLLWTRDSRRTGVHSQRHYSFPLYTIKWGGQLPYLQYKPPKPQHKNILNRIQETLQLEPKFVGLYSISVALHWRTQILGPNRELPACYTQVADPWRLEILMKSN